MEVYENRWKELNTEKPVNVVRCKDCKYYQNGVIFTDVKFCCRLVNCEGKSVRYNFSDNDFCSYGERREDDGQ